LVAVVAAEVLGESTDEEGSWDFVSEESLYRRQQPTAAREARETACSEDVEEEDARAIFVVTSSHRRG
jgi:hypothetical protein